MTGAGEPDWQLTKTLPERGRYLLEHRVWSDCEFLVGKMPNQEVISAHKLLLTMASPVFDGMFHGEKVKKDGFTVLSLPTVTYGNIIVTDIHPEIFKTMLLYIYTDTVHIQTFEEASELYYTAKKYMMINLKNICIKYFCKNLNEQNACKIFEIGHQLDDPILIRDSMSIIQRCTLPVIQQPKFTSVELTTLLNILDQDRLQINSEIDLFKAVSTWVVAECCRRKIPVDEDSMLSIAKSAMQKIRFLTMTATAFSTGPAKSGMLLQSEAFAILMNLTSKDSYPMPKGFSTSRVVRKY